MGIFQCHLHWLRQAGPSCAIFLPLDKLCYRHLAANHCVLPPAEMDALTLSVPCTGSDKYSLVPPNTRAVSNYLDHPMFGFRNFAALCVMRKPPKAHCGTFACCMTFPVDCCCILDPELSAYCAAFGVVRNPFDLDRSSAGSSGGPAAGASANFAMISLGSDTGNSIRGPSGHNGLVGIRSSIGQTSRWDWACECCSGQLDVAACSC